MRIFLITTISFFICSNALAQKNKVEKNTSGIQLFFVNGLIFYNEV